MAWLFATVIAIGTITALAAKVLVSRNPHGSIAGQALFAAASFPIITAILAAIVIAAQFAQKTPDTHDGSFGMGIFAIVMFWFYGLMASVLVALPTAFVAVRLFRD